MADTQTHQSLSEAVRSVIGGSPLKEKPTAVSAVPDVERAQQLLTPVQQLAMRDEIKKCKTVAAAVEVVDAEGVAVELARMELGVGLAAADTLS